MTHYTICLFCGSALTELNQNEHGNTAYDCPVCGIVHSSDLQEAEHFKLRVSRAFDEAERFFEHELAPDDESDAP